MKVHLLAIPEKEGLKHMSILVSRVGKIIEDLGKGIAFFDLDGEMWEQKGSSYHGLISSEVKEFEEMHEHVSNYVKLI
jgi:hypothetical protein